MIEGELNLIWQAKKGDAGAFGALYEHYLDPIYRFVYLKVGTKVEAEDLTHEVFLSAWQNLPSYSDRGFPFSSWLYQIARNRVIDFFRTRKLTTSLEATPEETLKLAGAPDDQLDNVLRLELVKAAIAELPEDHQTVVILRFVEDLPPADIAVMLGKSEGAVRLIQHRAVLRLRELIGQNIKTDDNAGFSGPAQNKPVVGTEV